jgi:uncharacterized membrane protein YeaQ/YmgE (transglycosylase-associated protein family)
MNILGWVILGAIAGWIASIIMKKNSQMGALANIVVGIVGAFIGGFLFHIFGGIGITGFNLWSIIVATIGAIVLLWIVNLFSKSKRAT